MNGRSMKMELDGNINNKVNIEEKSKKRLEVRNRLSRGSL